MGKDVLFSEWLNQQLVREKMTQADLVKATGLGTATISNLVNGKTKRPHPENCEKIAKALKLNNKTVLLAAKWITSEPEYEGEAELNMVAAQLPDKKRQELLAIARVMLEFTINDSANVG